MTGVELTGGLRNGELEHLPLGSSRWADLGRTTAGSVDAQVDATVQVSDRPKKPEPAPLLEVCVDLAPGMQTRTDRCIGDVPLLEFITGRARLVVSFDVGDLTVLTAEHVGLAEAFANAACELRDELSAIVAAHAVGGKSD
jgi:hypothetical protein